MHALFGGTSIYNLQKSDTEVPGPQSQSGTKTSGFHNSGMSPGQCTQ